jgi:AcrR family transcriptional regulator
VRAAIEIADAEGIEAISMRHIASVLGVGTMSLYWHVVNKDELLDLVFDEIFGEIEPLKASSGDWRADAEQIAHATRAVMHRHPWLTSLVGDRPALGPNLLRHLEASLAKFEPLGLSAGAMLGIMGTIDIWTIGFVVRELQERWFRQQNEMTVDELYTWMEPYVVEQLATGEYPAFARCLEQLSGPPSADEQFQFGLDCLLDGIEVRITAMQRASGVIGDLGDSRTGDANDLRGRDVEQCVDLPPAGARDC